MAESPPKIKLTLDTEKDWIPWLEYIFTLADEYGVKDYIDPNIPFLGLPTEPIRPSPSVIRPMVFVPAIYSPQIDYTRPILFSDLTPDEREQLH